MQCNGIRVFLLQKENANYQITMKIKIGNKIFCYFDCDLQKTLTLWQKSVAWRLLFCLISENN